MKIRNSRVISNLSQKSLRASGRRNLIAVLAIILTATLFTALFTVGLSLMDTMQLSTMRQVGTTSHAGFKGLTQAQYDAVAADPEVKDISYDIFIASGENPELNKTYTEIRYTEEKNVEWNFCKPTTGTLPIKKYDLATTTNVLDALGVPHELGQTVTLMFSVKGKQYTQDFTLCGFWEGDIAMGANEIYVSRAYCDEVAPVITRPLYETGEVDSAGTINPSLWFSNAWDIEGQMDALKQRLGFDERVNDGVNWAYSSATMDATTYALVIGILVLILASCYLIIYNVFEISVSRDIRFYGLLKTIGTTGRQLKKLVHRQALLLSVIGIPIGLLCGYLIGRLLMPAVMAGSIYADDFTVSFSPVIFIAAALFSLLTVRISCIRPCRIAARVSPIEAVRWTGVRTKARRRRAGKAEQRKTHRVTPYRMALASLRRERGKVTVVILSLTLSLVLLNGTYSIVKGFDMDIFLENYTVSDFLMTDASILQAAAMNSTLDGISPDTMADIRALPGLEDAGAVWAQLGKHKLSDEAYQRALEMIDRYEGTYLLSPYADETIKYVRETQALDEFLFGVDESLWDKLELADGKKLDKKAFASGDYVLATAFFDTGEDPYYQPGDKVTLDFGNGKTKTYTVLALGHIPYSVGPRFSTYMDIRFTLPADEYAKQLGETGALGVSFNVDDAHLDDAEQWCQTYTETVNPNLDYTSRATIAEEFHNSNSTFSIVGGALTIILALIGILNFINAVVTSVDARQKELAVLQSIGMTGKQLRHMLRWEGLLYAGMTLVLALTVGNVLCYALVKLITREMWYFTWHFSVLPLVLCAPVLFVICILVPAISYRSMCRQTVVERLREVE